MASSTFANAQLSNGNCPKVLSKNSLQSLVLNVEDKLSNLELIVGSQNENELDEETNLFSGVLTTKADQTRRQKKNDYKTSQSNTAKCANLPNEIFDYIYIAKC